MALHEKTINATYLSIWDGSIVQKRTEPKEGYERHEKDGKVSYVKRYPGFDGYISDIAWFDREIPGGKRIKGYNLILTDGGETFQLSMPLNSAATNVFMNCAGNIDFSQKVDFSVWKDREGKTAFLMRQPDRTGETVKRCHTKDRPNGMPEARFNERRREWDFTDVEDFLMAKMEDEIIPKCKKAAAARSLSEPKSEPQFTGAAEEKEDAFDNVTRGRGEQIDDEDIPWLK